MARTHAKLLTSIWSDQDFISLPAGTQRLYMVLVSQPKLSICGVIDYVPVRWANTAPDTNTRDIERSIALLEEHRFVIVDRDTAELLIRSFVKNDGVCHRWQMVKAMWSAWGAVASPALRARIVSELPPEAWNTEKAGPPDIAIAIRDRIRDGQRQCPPDWQSASEWQHLQPATCNLQPAAGG